MVLAASWYGMVFFRKWQLIGVDGKKNGVKSLRLRWRLTFQEDNHPRQTTKDSMGGVCSKHIQIELHCYCMLNEILLATVC